METHSDIICIDKPVGITSFDVLRILQRLYQMKTEGAGHTLTFSPPQRGDREPEHLVIPLTPQLDALFEYYGARNPEAKKFVCGHAGTLDPMASGLMIVGIGRGTKQLKHYVGLPKTYVAEICIGIRTTTSDMEGGVVESAIVSEIPEDRLRKILSGMEGVLRLPVSAFSAIKRGGKPLYKKAQKGKDVGELPVRDMEVYRATYLKSECVGQRCFVTAEFHVASGVYIRSLAEELGRQLQHPATLKNLRRTEIGDFRVTDAGVIKM